MKLKPALIHSGKVEKFNIIQNEIPRRKLMQYPAGCVVVFVFDTDKDVHPDESPITSYVQFTFYSLYVVDEMKGYHKMLHKRLESFAHIASKMPSSNVSG